MGKRVVTTESVKEYFLGRSVLSLTYFTLAALMVLVAVGGVIALVVTQRSSLLLPFMAVFLAAVFASAGKSA